MSGELRNKGWRKRGLVEAGGGGRGAVWGKGVGHGIRVSRGVKAAEGEQREK